MRRACTVLVLAACGAQDPPVPPAQEKPVTPAHSQEARPETKEPRRANRLKGETSPYLLQHAHNPVDWQPWDEAALAQAKREKKPIFLSIGYSACHWCHVMERESFEDARIAALLNERFVCIKVDREERPDLDEIYMAAVVRLNNGNGGWPMSVFLTPDGKPYLGGTYYPPARRHGMPGFDEVVQHAHKVWVERQDAVLDVAKSVVASLEEEARLAPAEAVPGPETLERALQWADQRFDPLWGGFGGGGRFAPKFPHCSELLFLLRWGRRTGNARALEIAEKTLEHMARGGMYDQVGGGFARYSVDREWLVPHFEKMLYDNAQLAQVYLEAWQATGKPLYKRIASEVLDYVRREMTGEEGGFFSATDADSEGVEGKFFVWTKAEFESVLKDGGMTAADVALLGEFFGVTAEGNFEHGGLNVLTRRVGVDAMARQTRRDRAELDGLVAKARCLLYGARAKRVPPHKDDKVLAAWNGLMLSAFARAGAVLGNESWLETARKNATFLLDEMRDEKSRLFRTRRGGRSHLMAYLEDYTAVTAGLVDLYEADGDPRWIGAARQLQGHVEKHFADLETGGYFSTADDHETLIVRRASAQESSLPSDVGQAAMNALRLGLLAGEPALLERARAVLKRHGQELVQYPHAFGALCLVLDFLQSGPKEVYVAGARQDPTTRAFLAKLRGQWPPYRVLALVEPGQDGALADVLPAARGKVPVAGKSAAYVCTEGTCKAPVLDPAGL